MSTDTRINLKSFPIIKLISAILFIIGGILAYLFSSKPEVMLFQIGGIPLGLVIGIPPILCGIVLILYSVITFYNVEVHWMADKLIIKSRKNVAEFNQDDIKAVRVRDAGKFILYFIFVFINFYFVYYGIECSLYFSANHDAGLLEFVLIPMFMVWFANVLLIIFQRKLLIFMGNESAVIQKINHLPKDGSFETLIDSIFGINAEKDSSKILKTNIYQYRLVLGITMLAIFSLTSMLVDIDDIIQPLHDLGIFIPIFLLLFSVMLISSALKEPTKQERVISDDIMKLKESNLIDQINGKNFLWLKSKNSIDNSELARPEFRRLTIYQYALISIIFGGAFYLAFKFIWIPSIYLSYLSIPDILIGILILAVLFFFQFEIRYKLNVNLDSEMKFRKEILVVNKETRELGVKNKIKNYFSMFKSLVRSDLKVQLVGVVIAYAVALILITISIYSLGFMLFWYI